MKIWPSLKKFTNTKLILVLIILLGFILRFYLLGVNPPSLDWDEASIGYNAFSILQTGKDEYGNLFPTSFRSFDDYKPPVYIYLTVPSVAIFGLNEFAVRFPAALIGVLAILVVYFFTKEIFENSKQKEWIALAASFFLAISPWHLQFSRAAFEGNIGVFFLITSLLFFLKSFKKPYYLLLSTCFFVLSLYSYHSFRLIVPITLIVISVLFYKQILKNKIWFLISLVVIILFSFPVYSSFFSPQGTGSRLSMVTVFQDVALQKMAAQKTLEAKQNNDLTGQVLFNRRVIFIPQIIKGYFDHFRFDFLFLRGDGGVQHHAYNFGMLYLWDLPFILLGLYLFIKYPTRKTMLVLILFLIAPLPASITSGTPHPVRAINMIPAFQIFTAVGVVWVVGKVRSNLKIGLFIVLGIFLILNFTFYLYSYYALTPIKYGYFWQFGNKEALDYAKRNEEKYDKVIMSYEYDQPYIYYLFYNKIDPSWYQNNWNYSGNGTVDRFYRKIGKYEFRNINYEKDQQLKNTLFIGTPKELIKASPLVKILYLDKKAAYIISKSND